MKVTPTSLPEVLLIEPQVFGDDRGFFFESWNQRQLDERVGQPLRFVQDIPLDARDPAWAVVERTEAALSTLAEKPILLPWGLKDFVFDAAFLERFIEAWPNAEVERYPDCGHYLIEDGGAAVVERISRFLGR